MPAVVVVVLLVRAVVVLLLVEATATAPVVRLVLLAAPPRMWGPVPVRGPALQVVALVPTALQQAAVPGPVPVLAPVLVPQQVSNPVLVQVAQVAQGLDRPPLHLDAALVPTLPRQHPWLPRRCHRPALPHPHPHPHP